MRIKSREGDKGKFKTKVVSQKKFQKKSWHSIYTCVKTKKLCYQLLVLDKKGDGIKQGKVKMFEDDKKIYNAKFNTGKKLTKNFGKCGKKIVNDVLIS